jgi:hypothetical protein
MYEFQADVSSSKLQNKEQHIIVYSFSSECFKGLH